MPSNAICEGERLTANKEVTIFKNPPTSGPATVTVSYCNNLQEKAVVMLSIGPGVDSAAPGCLNLEKNWAVEPGKTKERTGLVVPPGYNLHAASDRDNVDAVVFGYRKGS